MNAGSTDGRLTTPSAPLAGPGASGRRHAFEEQLGPGERRSVLRCASRPTGMPRSSAVAGLTVSSRLSSASTSTPPSASMRCDDVLALPARVDDRPRDGRLEVVEHLARPPHRLVHRRQAARDDRRLVAALPTAAPCVCGVGVVHLEPRRYAVAQGCSRSPARHRRHRDRALRRVHARSTGAALAPTITITTPSPGRDPWRRRQANQRLHQRALHLALDYAARIRRAGRPIRDSRVSNRSMTSFVGTTRRVFSRRARAGCPVRGRRDRRHPVRTVQLRSARCAAAPAVRRSDASACSGASIERLKRSSICANSRLRGNGVVVDEVDDVVALVVAHRVGQLEDADGRRVRSRRLVVGCCRRFDGLDEYLERLA